MGHDGFVHFVAAHAHRARIHNARKGNDRHLRSTAADIHHHVGGGLLNGQVRADGCGHGLFNKVDLARAGGLGRFLHRALFHLGDARGHADHDARAHQPPRIVHLGDEVTQHGFGNFKIGDNAVLHGADGPDIAGRSAQHALGVVPHGQNHVVAAGVFFDRHH